MAGPPLTSNSVNKIAKTVAKKVIKKQAKTLTVANANNLGGLPPSAYGTTTYRYRLPTGAAASVNKVFTFPGLPAGTDGGGTSTNTGSAVLAVGATSSLFCRALSGSFTVYTGGDVTSNVSFTKIDTLGGGTSTGTRPATEGVRPGSGGFLQ